MKRNGKWNEAWRISRFRSLLMALGCFAGGIAYAAALPPYNLEFLALISLWPILYAAREKRSGFLFFCGWCYGVGWALFAFRFLREIEPFIPWLLAPVLALWPALWAMTLPMLRSSLLRPVEAALWNASQREDFDRGKIGGGKLIFYVFTAAAGFTLLEWTRSRLFVWNDFSVTQWRNLPLIQLASVTGSYGVGFLVALANTASFALLTCRKRGIPAFLAALLLWGAAYGFGFLKLNTPLPAAKRNLRIALIQPDLSQRRFATGAESLEAIEVCFRLSRQIAQQKPDLIVWPESAVPVPLRAAGETAALYRAELRKFLQEFPIPMLIGGIDFTEDGKGVTNSALAIDPRTGESGKYDKRHRVPYGEYVPFRAWLPQWIGERIDMGRDLTPGNSAAPLTICGKAFGIAVCYEGVFGYVMRETARQGAQLLAVLSNDAWYPKSSEPEQHLANAVMRAVETGLPMLRCGNNGGSGVVTPQGRFTGYIGSASPRPELLRERAAGIAEISVPERTTPTICLRYGEWFVLLLFLLWLSAVVTAVRKNYLRKECVRRALSAER